MSKIVFLCYAKCSTCRKAFNWLKNNDIEVVARPIAEEKPTAGELKEWIAKSDLPVRKFFNTSGRLYKERNLKDLIPTASDDELIALLSSDGMLVKRPLLITPDKILVGFDENRWSDFFRK
ncbi:arsenate reductase [Dysgonomonas sp. PH5-45]|uniref:arsenate reductase family protein n=1 Tax=unclassified Dysgonomonas TaxID=2630389 RepID=UPI00247401AE|nr:MULTISPECIES: arsenate reductase family protein [unclassified Dysgonomonas]MDH6355827.1 arsenate reductase [Dysgonomonas sp. PH5-45]MDH6388706.1 arsenate reductase [Dysgonomonas sp. PH5-37]